MTGAWELNLEEFYQELVDEFETYIRDERVEFEECVIFGSYGRGTGSEDSDLDVLIVVSNADAYRDVERRDKFRGWVSRLEDASLPYPDPVTEIDVLLSTPWNRDKILSECIEEVPRSELIECPCLAYNVTKEAQVPVLHP